MVEYIIIFLYSFLLGTIPTAWLVMKKARNMDITKEGSGNVGAMNSYEVSGSKMIGVIVFIVDFLKGLTAVFITSLLFEENFIFSAISMNAVVLGHCFNPWLGFRGGRGLASAAGSTAIFSPLILLLWGIFWVIGYIFKKSIHFGNITATFLTGILAYTSADILNKYTSPSSQDETLFGIFFGILMLIVIVKHIGPILDWLKLNKRTKVEDLNERT
ncbi:MAG: hypothetical protein SCALA702_23030 [Melioribacteraceae bacterium]|nr:MAG: hypothetical protein SCALA702_23030 [Melioribacteraceae bacterium]